MNFIDIVLAIPLLWGAYKGFKKGLIIELFTLLALLVGIYAGIHFSDIAAEKINGSIELEDKYIPVVSFTLTFLVVGAIIFFAGKMIEKMVEVVNLSPVNKILGLLLGVIKMIYTLSILIILVETYDERGDFIPLETKEESVLYGPVQQIALKTIPAVDESKIWLKNNIQKKKEPKDIDLVALKNVLEHEGMTMEDANRILTKGNLSFDDVIVFKRVADSLDISLSDLKQLKEQLKAYDK